MGIDIALYPNYLTEDEKDCFAMIQNKQVLTQEKLIQRMTGRGLSLLDTDVKKVMEEEVIAMIDSLREGYAIETPLMTITPTIRGKFDHKEDVFDPARHSIEFIVKLGKAVEVDKDKIAVRKVKATVKTPMILKVEDHFTETFDERLMPGGTVSVRGIDLKVNETADDEGLYFKVNGTVLKVEKFFNNTDSHLQVKVPNALAGETCTLEVRKRYPRSKQLHNFIYEVGFLIGS